MRDTLAKDFYVDPQVMVTVKEYGGQVFIMGEVSEAWRLWLAGRG